VDTEHGEFRRAGAYDMPTPPAVLREVLQRLCVQHGYNSVQANLTDIGIEYGAVTYRPMPATDDPAPAPSCASADAGRSSKRSEGMKGAWRTRHAVDRYMEQHPGVSRDEARHIIKGDTETRPRTRATEDDAPRQLKGERGWDTRIQHKIESAAQNGETIDWDEGRRRVVEDMRNRRRATANRAAAAPEPEEPETETAPDAVHPPDEGQSQAA